MKLCLEVAYACKLNHKIMSRFMCITINTPSDFLFAPKFILRPLVRCLPRQHGVAPFPTGRKNEADRRPLLPKLHKLSLNI